jgi:5-methylcytosine-specific restriction endonuclease McrA
MKDFSIFSDWEIMEFFLGRCQICGSTYQVSLHHLIFRSQGGTNGPRLPLCGKCHIAGVHGTPEFRRKHEERLFEIADVFYTFYKENPDLI